MKMNRRIKHLEELLYHELCEKSKKKVDNTEINVMAALIADMNKHRNRFHTLEGFPEYNEAKIRRI